MTEWTGESLSNQFSISSSEGFVSSLTIVSATYRGVAATVLLTMSIYHFARLLLLWHRRVRGFLVPFHLFSLLSTLPKTISYLIVVICEAKELSFHHRADCAGNTHANWVLITLDIILSPLGNILVLALILYYSQKELTFLAKPSLDRSGEAEWRIKRIRTILACILFLVFAGSLPIAINTGRITQNESIGDTLFAIKAVFLVASLTLFLVPTVTLSRKIAYTKRFLPFAATKGILLAVALWAGSYLIDAVQSSFELFLPDSLAFPTQLVATIGLLSDTSLAIAERAVLLWVFRTLPARDIRPLLDSGVNDSSAWSLSQERH